MSDVPKRKDHVRIPKKRIEEHLTAAILFTCREFHRDLTLADFNRLESSLGEMEGSLAAARTRLGG